MISQSPRIYLYKITFEEVPYYYYGVHKEKYFNEEYWGSPIAHKWCWELYTPKKQILEIFEFSDEGWLKAQEVEKRLIKPFFNADKWCLNENCAGGFSLSSLKKGYIKNLKNKTGICSLSKEELSFYGSISGNNHKENGTGFFKLSDKEKKEICKKAGVLGGKKSAENKKRNKTSFWNSKFQSDLGKRGGNKTKELGVGIFGKWICLETGHITTSGPLTRYQRARGIDTSKRKRLE
jgi:hypothetical protein